MILKYKTRYHSTLKRIICLFLILLFAVSISGCGINPSDTFSTDSPSNTEDSPDISWTESHTKLGNTGAYLLDEITVPNKCYISSIAVKDSYAAVATVPSSQVSSASNMLTVYDLSKKKVKWELNLSGDDISVGFLSDGSVCTHNSTAKKVYIYSIDGKVQFEYSADSVDGNVYADDNAGLWLIGNNTLFCLKDGKVVSYPLTFFGVSPTIASVKNGRVFYAYWADSNCAAYYDVEAKENKWLSLLDGYSAGDGLFYMVADGKMFYSSDGEKISYLSLPAGAELTFAKTIGNKPVLRGVGKTYVLDTEKSTLHTVDAQEYFTGIFAGQTQGSILRHSESGKEQVGYFVDFALKGDAVNLSKVIYSDEQLANKAKAEGILEKYGIYTRWTKFESGDGITEFYKSGRAQTDAEISTFLSDLDATLSKYPKSLAKEITRGDVAAFRVHSVGSIVTSGAPDTLSSAGAITYEKNHAITIAISTESLSENTISERVSHELMHAFELVLEKENPNKDLFADWNKLNPSAFSYVGEYSDSPGTWEYVFNYYNQDYSKDYFVNQYGKTNGKEDRATILESMCLSDVLVFKSPHIKAKAEYLEKFLKEQFPAFFEDSKPIWLNYKQ